MLNFNLRTRLTIGYVVPFLLITLLAVFTLTRGSLIDTEFSTVSERNVPATVALGNLKFEGSRLISSANELVLDALLSELSEEEDEGEGEEESEADEILEAIDGYEVALGIYAGLLNNEEVTQFYEAVEVSGQVLLDLGNTLLTIDPDDAAELLEIREGLEDAEVDFLQAIEAAVAHETDVLTVSQNTFADLLDQIGSSVVVIAAIIVGLSLIAGLFVFRSIARPMQQLQQTASKLQVGDLAARADVRGQDEIARVAQAMNSMAERIQKTVKDLEVQVDVAERARAEAERSDQVKSAFLASMSHELRTPLNAIINFTKFVAGGDLGPVNEQQETTLNQVVDSSKHLLTLINDVLDMSKIESGSLNLFVEDDVELKKILERVVSTGQGLIQDKPVELKTDVPEQLPMIRGDKQRIYQIILNLMSNACKFTESGYILLRAEYHDDEVIISVKDTGPGIAPSDHALIFEAFKQSENGLRQSGGTGLGLPIAKNLIEIHGGRLWLDSEVGTGSTFFFTLPVKFELLIPTLTE